MWQKILEMADHPNKIDSVLHLIEVAISELEKGEVEERLVKQEIIKSMNLSIDESNFLLFDQNHRTLIIQNQEVVSIEPQTEVVQITNSRVEEIVEKFYVRMIVEHGFKKCKCTVCVQQSHPVLI